MTHIEHRITRAREQARAIVERGATPLHPVGPAQMVVLVAERCAHQPENLAELGLVRVRYAMRSGGWSYDVVPVEAVVG